MHSRRLRRIFALVALVLVAVPFAARAPLFDPDEGLHAAIAQEMNLRGDYVTPTFLGEPFLDKPILFFWSEAASLRVFGSSEAAVRVPPTLFALLSMLGVAALGHVLFGTTAGLLAGICYATMLLPLGVGEIAVHDVALAPFICGASLALVKIAERRSFWLWSAMAAVCLGLSILTKGLVGLAFVGLFYLCLSARRPRDAVRLTLALGCAAAVAAIIAAPWYIAMERAHPGYLHYYFIDRHVRGFLTATQLHAGRPWWYYAPVLAGGAIPWTGYAFRAAADARRHAMLPVLWGWLAAGFVFLSVAQSKLGIYALPLFIAVALVTGEYVNRGIVERGRTFDSLFAVHGTLLALLAPIGLAIVCVRFHERPPNALTAIVVAAGLAIVGVGVWALRSRAPFAMVDALGRMTAMAIIALVGVIEPRAADWMTGRDLAQYLNRSSTLPPHIDILDERVGSLVFYLDPVLRGQAAVDRFTDVSAAEAFADIRRGPADAIIAVRNDQLQRFTRLFASAPPVHARAGTFSVYRVGDLRPDIVR